MPAFDGNILGMLKTFFAKDGIENLLYRNDPFLKTIKTVRVEGKQANFSALYSRGGAVSANFLTAKKLAKESAQAKEFQVTPGQLFSSCVYTAKEVQASKTLKGAYMNVVAAKFFANAESFRKTLAVALYGTGHGELYTTSASISVVDGDVNVTMPQSAIMGIDIGSEIEFKASAAATAVITTVTVKKINGTTVTLTGTEAKTVASGSVACISGCTDTDGSPLLPVGLGGWIPTSVATTDSFYGVNRSEARDRLAGTYIAGGAAQKKYEVIEDAIIALRRMGSLCDKIIMNDKDYLAMMREIESKTYMPKSGAAKSGATLGFDKIGFAINTSWVDDVVDSPYCPEGRAYVLSSDTVEMWTYTNADKVADGIVANEMGKADPNSEEGVEGDRPYALITDDLFSLQPGQDTAYGPASLASLMFYGNFVVTNPSVNAVVTFAA